MFYVVSNIKVWLFSSIFKLTNEKCKSKATGKHCSFTLISARIVVPSVFVLTRTVNNL